MPAQVYKRKLLFSGVTGICVSQGCVFLAQISLGMHVFPAHIIITRDPCFPLVICVSPLISAYYSQYYHRYNDHNVAIVASMIGAS